MKKKKMNFPISLGGKIVDMLPDEEENMECSICGAIMRSIHETHNPEPIKPCEERCCGDCNALKVIPARLALMGYKLDEKEKDSDS